MTIIEKTSYCTHGHEYITYHLSHDSLPIIRSGNAKHACRWKMKIKTLFNPTFGLYYII